jgi:cytoskeleton protein RodZ
MDEGVGRTLREARTRRKVDLAEVEAATKIRGRYLRAIENEHWDLLPGDTYARAFIRTYAAHLGLDGERLAEQQRRRRGVVRPAERLPKSEPLGPRPVRRKRRRPLPSVSPGVLALAVSLGLLAAIVAVGLSSGGGSSTPSTGSGGRGNSDSPRHQQVTGAGQAPRPAAGHVVELTANAEVWVCLLDADGEALIDGEILSAGTSEGPYRSGSFTVSFGNGAVTMMVDGQQASIPETASPVGYSIDAGELRQLSEGERPTCT